MWSSSFLRRPLAAVLLCALPVLSGCTLSPVYSSKESSEQPRLSYDETKDHLHELVYQDLKL